MKRLLLLIALLASVVNAGCKTAAIQEINPNDTIVGLIGKLEKVEDRGGVCVLYVSSGNFKIRTWSYNPKDCKLKVGSNVRVNVHTKNDYKL